MNGASSEPEINGRLLVLPSNNSGDLSLSGCVKGIAIYINVSRFGGIVKEPRARLIW